MSLRKILSPKKVHMWTKEEDKILKDKAAEYNYKNWNKISSFIEGTSAIQCCARYKRIQPGLKKGTWDKAEDNILLKLHKKYGHNWSVISRHMVNRTGKQIRDRFLNTLDKNLIKEKFSKEEDKKIIRWYKVYGNSWCKIAKKIKGRTGDMIKNRYYSYLKKIIPENHEKDKDKSSSLLIGGSNNINNGNSETKCKNNIDSNKITLLGRKRKESRGRQKKPKEEVNDKKNIKKTKKTFKVISNIKNNSGIGKKIKKYNENKKNIFNINLIKNQKNKIIILDDNIVKKESNDQKKMKNLSYIDDKDEPRYIGDKENEKYEKEKHQNPYTVLESMKTMDQWSKNIQLRSLYSGRSDNLNLINLNNNNNETRSFNRVQSSRLFSKSLSKKFPNVSSMSTRLFQPTNSNFFNDNSNYWPNTNYLPNEEKVQYLNKIPKEKMCPKYYECLDPLNMSIHSLKGDVISTKTNDEHMKLLKKLLEKTDRHLSYFEEKKTNSKSYK